MCSVQLSFKVRGASGVYGGVWCAAKGPCQKFWATGLWAVGFVEGLLPSQRHTNPEHSSLPRPPKVSKIMANTYAKLLFNILYFGV